MDQYEKWHFEIWEHGERRRDAEITCVSDIPRDWTMNGPTLEDVKAGFAERDALQARIDKARDEAANGIEFSMHGGRGGYAKRLCRIIEILEGDDG